MGSRRTPVAGRTVLPANVTQAIEAAPPEKRAELTRLAVESYAPERTARTVSDTRIDAEWLQRLGHEPLDDIVAASGADEDDMRMAPADIALRGTLHSVPRRPRDLDPPPGWARLDSGDLIPIPPKHRSLTIRVDSRSTNAALELRKLIADALRTPGVVRPELEHAYVAAFGKEPPGTPPWIGVLLDEVEAFQRHLMESQQQAGRPGGGNVLVRASDVVIRYADGHAEVASVRGVEARWLKLPEDRVHRTKMPAVWARAHADLPLLDAQGRRIGEDAVEAFKREHAGAVFAIGPVAVRVPVRRAWSKQTASPYVEATRLKDDHFDVRTATVFRPGVLRAFAQKDCVDAYALMLSASDQAAWLDLDASGVLRRARRALPPEVKLPFFASAELVDWLAVTLSAGRGGGPTRRLSRDTLAKLLADESALTAELETRAPRSEIAERALEKVRAARRGGGGGTRRPAKGLPGTPGPPPGAFTGATASRR